MADIDPEDLKSLLNEQKTEQEQVNIGQINDTVKYLQSQKEEPVSWTNLAMGAIPLLTSAMMGGGGAEAADISSQYLMGQNAKEEERAKTINDFKMKAALQKLKGTKTYGSDWITYESQNHGTIRFNKRTGEFFDSAGNKIEGQILPLLKKGPNEQDQIIRGYNYQNPSDKKIQKIDVAYSQGNINPLPNQIGSPVLIEATGAHGEKVQVPIEKWDTFIDEQKIPPQLVGANETGYRIFNTKIGKERESYLGDTVVKEMRKDVYDYDMAQNSGSIGSPQGESVMGRLLAKSANTGTLTDADVDSIVGVPSFAGGFKKWINTHFGVNGFETALGPKLKENLTKLANESSRRAKDHMASVRSSFAKSALNASGIPVNEINLKYALSILDPDFGSAGTFKKIKQKAPDTEVPSIRKKSAVSKLSDAQLQALRNKKLKGK
jgi:hypothetical protein